MKDGSLTINFEEGRVKGVSVDAGLELTYAEMFAAAQTRLRESPEDLDAAIRLVVFGCFWLEATCNNHLERMLHRKLEPRLAAALWAALDRRSVPEKLAILSAFARDKASQPFERVLAGVKDAFWLRNKLVHYKKEPSAIAETLELEELMALIEKHEDLPEAELIRRLRAPSITRISEQVQVAKEWMDVIYAEHAGKVETTSATDVGGETPAG